MRLRPEIHEQIVESEQLFPVHGGLCSQLSVCDFPLYRVIWTHFPTLRVCVYPPDTGERLAKALQVSGAKGRRIGYLPSSLLSVCL